MSTPFLKLHLLIFDCGQVFGGLQVEVASLKNALIKRKIAWGAGKAEKVLVC